MTAMPMTGTTQTDPVSPTTTTRRLLEEIQTAADIEPNIRRGALGTSLRLTSKAVIG